MSMISEDAIKKYVQRRVTDLTACQKALEDKDAAVMENIGHKMKGNGLTFGYPELADIGRDMESAAVEKNWEVLAAKVSEFEHWLEDKKDLAAPDSPGPQPSL